MKLLVVAAALACLSSAAFAGDVYVAPYVKKDGTLVQGHMQTAPNSTPLDNYSTKGNVNPYTGQAGTKEPYVTPHPAPAYVAPAPVVVQPSRYGTPKRQ